MSKRLRLLVLNERDPEHPQAGGAEIHVSEIFSRLVARGFSVRQLSVGFAGGAPESNHRGIQIERKRPLARYYTAIPGRLRRARADEEFDLVVDCLNKVPFYSPLYAGVPVLAVCHHLFGDVAFEQVSRPVAAAVWIAERGLPWAYRKTRILAISASSRDDLIARGLRPEQISISHPGFDRPRIPVDLDRRRPCRLAYFGRLEPYKRVDLFLEAATLLVERFPELEIVVIGRGSERARLEAQAQRLGLGERIRFLGFIPSDERDREIALARACAFPSSKEGWGLTVIEAAALGTPVVASDAPGLRDSVRHEETGLLVPPNDAAALAEGLGRLLEDSSFASDMRRAAFEWSERFGWDRAADEMASAIEAACGERAASGIDDSWD